jgi:hypothetical protein
MALVVVIYVSFKSDLQAVLGVPERQPQGTFVAVLAGVALNDDLSGKVVPFRRERGPAAARALAPAAAASAPQKPIPDKLVAHIVAAKRLAEAADADLLTYLLDCCDLEARTLQTLAPPPLRLDDPA